MPKLRKLTGLLLVTCFLVSFITFSNPNDAVGGGSNIFLLTPCVIFLKGGFTPGWECVHVGGNWWYQYCQPSGGGSGGGGDGDPEQ